MAKRVDFETRGGAKAQGEIVEPAGAGKAPVVVLIQEWWGVNDHIRSLLDRLAGEGFVALAPDLFHGKTTKDPEEAGRLMGALDWGGALDEIGGAARFALAHPRSNGRVGVMGFCMGGALTFAAAQTVPEFSAAVPFYGLRNPDEFDAQSVRAPIMAHFAKHDDWARADAARAVQAKLQAQGKTMELFVYDAQHAFVNDTRPEVHDPDAARLAWERTIDFLHKHLG